MVLRPSIIPKMGMLENAIDTMFDGIVRKAKKNRMRYRGLEWRVEVRRPSLISPPNILFACRAIPDSRGVIRKNKTEFLREVLAALTAFKNENNNRVSE
jgi:hypothetical protein